MINRHNIQCVQHPNSKGFTLVELMIAVSVLAILTAIALPSFKQLVGNSQIRTVAESISNGLQMARSEAIKRNAQVIFTLNNDTSWTVGCVTVVAGTCPAVIYSKPNNEGSGGVVTITRTGSNNIIFTSFGIATTTAGQLSQVNIDNSTLSASDSKDLRITIGLGGNARVCDPNVIVVTDSRYCI